MKYFGLGDEDEITTKCATGASLLQPAYAYDRLMEEKRKEALRQHVRLTC